MFISTWPWCICQPNLVQIALSNSELLTFFWNSKWRPPPSCIFKFSEFGTFWRVESAVLKLCIKFGSNTCRSMYNRATQLCFSFRFQPLVMWSFHGRDVSSHNIWCRYLYPIRSYWYFSEIQNGGRRHLGFVGSLESWDHPRRFIRGAYPL